MNRILLSLTALFTSFFTMTVYAQDNTANMKTSKILVAYFSATGTTAGVAKDIAEITGGELYEIVPSKNYTNADLDWNDKKSRSSVEMNNPQSRPALKSKKGNIQEYDIIFLGYPIWWDLSPRIINTFIESHALKGKKLGCPV